LNSNEIKHRRFESILKDLIGEAIATMNDSRLNSLSIVDVVCSRGKQNVTIYLFDDGQEDKTEIIRQLRKSVGYINKYCLASESWYKMPKLDFKFDNNQDIHIEALFDKIKRKSEQPNE